MGRQAGFWDKLSRARHYSLFVAFAVSDRAGQTVWFRWRTLSRLLKWVLEENLYSTLYFLRVNKNLRETVFFATYPPFI